MTRPLLVQNAFLVFCWPDKSSIWSAFQGVCLAQHDRDLCAWLLQSDKTLCGMASTLSGCAASESDPWSHFSGTMARSSAMDWTRVEQMSDAQGSVGTSLGFSRKRDIRFFGMPECSALAKMLLDQIVIVYIVDFHLKQVKSCLNNRKDLFALSSLNMFDRSDSLVSVALSTLPQLQPRIKFLASFLPSPSSLLHSLRHLLTLDARDPAYLACHRKGQWPFDFFESSGGEVSWLQPSKG